MHHRLHTLVPALVLAALVGIATGCSEKPAAHRLKWETTPGLPSRRASLRAVIASSADHAIAIGFDRPEGLTDFFPLSFARDASSWRSVPLPLPEPAGSVSLWGATRSADGVVWACGWSARLDADPIGITPVIYRYAGSWSIVPIAGLGDLDGVHLEAIAASGAGASLELRAVGAQGFGISGVALRRVAGAWQIDSLPTPLGAPPHWTLTAVGRAPDGAWYAAGTLGDGLGAVLDVDDGAGWRSLPTPPDRPGLEFRALAFDAEGDLWLAADETVGGAARGLLLRWRDGGYEPVSIARKSAGAFHLNAIAFSREGYGWVGGGRDGQQPFFAGTSGAGWTESLAEAVEHDTHLAGGVAHESLPAPRANAAVTGEEIFGIAVLGAEAAYAVGYRTEIDFKGFTESVANVYRLVKRPVGEVEGVAAP